LPAHFLWVDVSGFVTHVTSTDFVGAGS